MLIIAFIHSFIHSIAFVTVYERSGFGMKAIVVSPVEIIDDLLTN